MITATEFRFGQLWQDANGLTWKVGKVKNKRAYLYCEKNGRDIQRPSGMVSGLTLIQRGWSDQKDGKRDHGKIN